MMAARWFEFDDDWVGMTLAMRLCVVYVEPPMTVT